MELLEGVIGEGDAGGAPGGGVEGGTEGGDGPVDADDGEEEEQGLEDV